MYTSRGRTTMLLIAACALALGAPAHAQLDRGVELYKAGKFQEAEAPLMQAAEAQPQSVRANYFLGVTLLELEKPAEAEQRLVAIGDGTDQDVRREHVLTALARARMAQKQFDGAQSDLDMALKIAPKDPDVYLQRGKLGIHREDFSSAGRELDMALKLAPKNAYAHYYAAIAFSNTGRPDRMADHFQMFLRLAPDAPEAAKVRSLLRSIR